MYIERRTSFPDKLAVYTRGLHNYIIYRKIPKISPSKYKPPNFVTQKTLR